MYIHMYTYIKFYVHIQAPGSYRYMSPEVLDARVNLQDLQSFMQIDVYAFALIMWEIMSRTCMLSGQWGCDCVGGWCVCNYVVCMVSKGVTVWVGDHVCGDYMNGVFVALCCWLFDPCQEIWGLKPLKFGLPSDRVHTVHAMYVFQYNFPHHITEIFFWLGSHWEAYT